MTWNVGRDSIFAGGARHDSFARVLKAVQPDVVCMQEVWRGSGEAAALLDAVLPLSKGRLWQHHGVLDNAIVSRFDLSLPGAGTIDVEEGRKRGHASALATRDDNSSLYLICSHFQSRDRPVSRERHADSITTSISTHKADGTLPAGTPIIVLGDLNAIATLPPLFVENLRNGRIGGNLPRQGRGPDWDGSSLEDAEPQHNGRGDETWTWRNDREPYPPGSLDRVLYTGSVMAVDHAFVLNTTTMSDEELRDADLLRDDTMFNAAQGIHDHLPVVVDFVLAMDQR